MFRSITMLLFADKLHRKLGTWSLAYIPYGGADFGEVSADRQLAAETVIAAVVNFAVTQPFVDRVRIGLSGWNIGGYLAPRAASGEPRIAALVADPGT